MPHRERTSSAEMATLPADEAVKRIVMDTTDPDDEVSQASGCPSCGERRIDWLVIDEDGEAVACITCGKRYSLPQQERGFDKGELAGNRLERFQ